VGWWGGGVVGWGGGGVVGWGGGGVGGGGGGGGGVVGVVENLTHHAAHRCAHSQSSWDRQSPRARSIPQVWNDFARGVG
jgi:hypothetical protein